MKVHGIDIWRRPKRAKVNCHEYQVAWHYNDYDDDYDSDYDYDYGNQRRSAPAFPMVCCAAYIHTYILLIIFYVQKYSDRGGWMAEGRGEGSWPCVISQQHPKIKRMEPGSR